MPLNLHSATVRGSLESCRKVGVLEFIYDIEDAANGAPYTSMSFTEVMDNIDDLDSWTGEVTQDMLRDRSVLELVKHNVLNGLLRVA